MQTDTLRPFDNVSTKLIACRRHRRVLVARPRRLDLAVDPGAAVPRDCGDRRREALAAVRGDAAQNETLRGYLDRTEGFADLPLGAEDQGRGLLFVKMLIDGVALLVAGVMKLLKAAEG